MQSVCKYQKYTCIFVGSVNIFYVPRVIVKSRTPKAAVKYFNLFFFLTVLEILIKFCTTTNKSVCPENATIKYHRLNYGLVWLQTGWYSYGIPERIFRKS